jgi:hypothetical protein
MAGTTVLIIATRNVSWVCEKVSFSLLLAALLVFDISSIGSLFNPLKLL